MGRRPKTRPRSAPATPAAWRFTSWPLPLFLLAVFLVKLAVLRQLGDHPLLQPEGGLDAAEYFRLARRVLDGDVLLGPGLYFVSPLYIYFLAALMSISESLAFVRGVQAALGTAAVGWVFVASRAWFGTRAAWFAAALAALTGVFTFYEIVLFQSSLDTFLTAAGLALLAAGFRKGPDISRLIGGAGVVFGLQIINRPNMAIAVAGIAIAIVAMRQLRAALLFAAGVAIALAPVAARNAIVSGQFALTSSQGGLNLYIGNHAAATGQYVPVPGVTANITGQAEDTRRVAEQATGRRLTDTEVSSYFATQATGWMREHPGKAGKLFVRKLALVFNARHQWLDFSYPYYAHDTGSWLRWLFVGPWLLVPLGLAGLVAAVRPAIRSGGSVLLAAFVILYALSVAIFFVAERYRLPLLVALCVSSGAAIDALLLAVGRPAADAAVHRARGRLAAVAVAGLCGAVVAAYPFDIPDGRYEERLRLSKILMNRRDYGGATAELERAFALKPGDTVTEFNLGMAMVSAGRPQEGLAHVRRAVDHGVPLPGARYALANAMLATGDREGAVTLLRTFYPEDRDSAESCFNVGILAMNAGAPRVAERYLLRALALRPGWSEALRALEQLR